MDDVLSLEHLLAAGMTHAAIRRMLRTGELIRVRRGWYRRGRGQLTPEQTHRLLMAATLPQTTDGAVVSHASAALLHGLPVPYAALRRVTMTRDRSGCGYASRTLRVRGCPVAEDEIVELNGIAVTSLARTVADIGRELSFDWAVGAADAALRLGLSGADLADQIRRGARRPGNEKARAMAGFADPAAESIGESLSRALFWRAGIPSPTLQREVRWHGTLVGRADFGWDEEGVLGEFDGNVKYGRDARPGESIADVVLREKERENRLRQAGWLVVRWTWDDLGQPGLVERRVRAMLRSGPGRVA